VGLRSKGASLGLSPPGPTLFRGEVEPPLKRIDVILILTMFILLKGKSYYYIKKAVRSQQVKPCSLKRVKSS
jgi:hypothetical protein